MKKFLYLFIFLFVLSPVFSGCSDDDDPVSDIRIVKSDSFFYARGGQGSIELAETDGTLSAKSLDDWCRITGTSGNTVTFEVSYLTTLESRTTEIVILSGDRSERVSVSQQGILFSMDENVDMLFPFDGGTLVIPYGKNNTSLEARPNATVEWLSYEHTEEGFLIKATPNAKGFRNTELAISLYDGDKVVFENISMVEIKQKGWLAPSDVSGTWHITYTAFPMAREGLLHQQMNKPEVIENRETVEADIQLGFEPGGTDLLKTTLSGYPLYLGMDNEKTYLSISGLREGLGTFVNSGSTYYVLSSLVGFQGGVFTVNDFHFNSDSQLIGVPSFRETQAGIEVTYTFSPAGKFTKATGFIQLGATASEIGNNIFAVLQGRFVEIYDQVKLTRVYPK